MTARIAASFPDDDAARQATQAIVEGVGVQGITISRIFARGDQGGDGLEGFLPGITDQAETTTGDGDAPRRPDPGQPLAGTSTLHTAQELSDRMGSEWSEVSSLLLATARRHGVLLVLDVPLEKREPVIQLLLDSQADDVQTLG